MTPEWLVVELGERGIEALIEKFGRMPAAAGPPFGGRVAAGPWVAADE